jgi:serine/threonine protein kinase
VTVVRLTSDSGQDLEYVDEVIGQGGMKDVYFSPDRSYVVAFFREAVNAEGKERLREIVGRYREGIYQQQGGDYWKDLFCWPTDTVQQDGRVGVVAPVYREHFFFEYGSKNNDMLGIKGQEKEGKWFASASNRTKFVDDREKGDWLKHLQLTLRLSRAVRRLHAAGLAHSDLSYKNVLVDPSTGTACIIDIDGLVVPGKFAPDVVGTPDFIAPEVVATQGLDRTDPNRKLPSRTTDLHALAVLIYMYLFYRHPLRGSKLHDSDPTKDDELMMGTGALFVEHPSDDSNRVNAKGLRDADKPWGDPSSMPYTIAGPLLQPLFERAFVDGLHDPSKRPAAAEWEHALIRTIDLIQPCVNTDCEMGWFVFDNTTAPACPLCKTAYTRKLPVLNLYSSRSGGKFSPDNHRVMVWDGQSLNAWHANRSVFPNEHLTDQQRQRVGYFQFHDGDWYLVNQSLPGMRDVGNNQDVAVGSHVKLADGVQLLLDPQDGGRLIQVQLVG